MIYRVASAHEEGGERVYSVSTKEFVGDDGKSDRPAHRPRSRSRTARSTTSRAPSGTIPAQLVLLAMGFTGPEQEGLVEQLGVDLDERGNIERDENYMSSVEASSSPATPGGGSR